MHNLRRTLIALHYITGVFIVCTGIASAATAHKNAFDMPVLNSDGKRITYSKDDFNGKGLLPVKSILTTPAVAALHGSRAMSEVPEFRANWAYPFLGSGLGLNLWAGDSDVGQAEIYAGSAGEGFGRNSFWVAFQHDSGGNSYQLVFCSEFFSAGISALTVADVTGDLRNEIIVCLENGVVQFYDQASKVILKQFSVPGSINAIRTADLDGTGTLEMIFCNDSSTAVYSDDEFQWSIAAGGADLAVGQMDNDPSMEIAVTSGQVIDCATRSVQWTYGTGFGRRLEAVDFDSDGKAELIAADSWYYVWAYDVDTQFPKWSYRTDSDVTALRLTDVDGDGQVEVAIGDGQWGDVYGIDPVSRALKYSIANPEHGVANIAAADVDGDGKTELIWGAGFSSTGKDELYVADPATQTIEWKSIDLDGPVVGPEIGDLDGDGKDELIISSMSSNSSHGSGRLLVFDNETLKLRAISVATFDNAAWEGIDDLKLYDVDNDGKLEIVLAAGNYYNGVVEIWEFKGDNTFARVWRNTANPDGETFTAVDVADVDGDGKLEILAGNGRSHSGSGGTFLRLMDYETRETKWTSFHLASGSSWAGIADVAAADVDSSAGLEMIALVNGGSAYIFDGITKDPKAIINGPFNHLRLQNQSLFLSTLSGAIKEFQYDGSKYAEVSSTQVSTKRIDGFEIVDAYAKILTFGQDGRLHVFAGGKVQSRSANYGVPYGARMVDNASGGAYCVGVHRDFTAPVLEPEPAVTQGTVNVVRWGGAAGAIGYTIDMATDAEFSNVLASETEFGIEHEFSGLQVDQTYYFRVKALFLDGQTESAWSASEFTFQEAVPAAAADWQLYL